MSISIFDELSKEVLQPRNREYANFKKGRLEKRNGYFIVKRDDEYYYFAAKVKVPESDTCPIFRFEQAPIRVAEGIMVIDKKLYNVPMQDLIRGVVRKSREIKPLPRKRNGKYNIATNTINPAGFGDSLSPEDIIISSGTASSEHSNEQGTGNSPELQLIQQADVYFQDQVESLLNSYNQEEGEWEVANIEEPIPDNESSTVQATDQLA